MREKKNMSSGEFKITQSTLFGRNVKKLRKQEKEVLDHEIRRLQKNPELGEEKKGDLRGVRVHKFKMNKQTIRLAYTIAKKELQLITFGLHENYYGDLKVCLL